MYDVLIPICLNPSYVSIVFYVNQLCVNNIVYVCSVCVCVRVCINAYCVYVCIRA